MAKGKNYMSKADWTAVIVLSAILIGLYSLAIRGMNNSEAQNNREHFVELEKISIEKTELIYNICGSRGGEFNGTNLNCHKIN